MKRIILIAFTLIAVNTAVFAADFSIHKLDNGQTVIIEEIHTNPIVTIDTWVKTGSINETDENNGVSHFLEHLFFKGTTNHKPGEFDKILESKGAINNAATSKDFTHYYITIPSKDFDLALKMHADMLQNPLIPRKELEKERKVVLEEISKDANIPTNKVYDNLISMLYTTHPYKRKVIGTSDVIEKITREEIIDYFNEYYNPSNMVTIIVGDVNTSDALKKVQSEFNKNYKKIPDTKYPKEKQLLKQQKKIENIETQSGYMLIGFRSTKISDKDSYALDVLSTILGDGKSSILYRNIKENKQLAFSISAINSTFRDDGIFYISANFTPKNYEELEKNIFTEIENIQKTGVTQEQVNLAKNIIERETYYSRESITNIAGELGYTSVTTGDTKFYETYINNINKVTPQDVKRVAIKYLGVNKSAISIVMPLTTNEIKISVIKKTEPEALLISKNEETQKYKLSNGLELLYTPNESNDIIAISITCKGGEFIEKLPGTGKLTASLMLKGTRKYSSKELAETLENNGIKILPQSQGDAFSISILTTKQEYDLALSLLDEIVNNAIFDDYEIEKVRTEKINAIKKNRDIPLQKAIEEYNTMIYKGSVYSNSGQILEKTYPKIMRTDIVEYYNKIFTPENIVISINGNIDKEKTLKELSKIFNRKSTEKIDYNNYKITENKASQIKIQTDKNTETAWIFIGWQTSGLSNLKEYATLQVIDSILGIGMSSRLFKNIREQEGLAYQLGTSYTPRILKGNFVMYIGTNPQTLNTAKTKLFEEINKIKTEYVGTQELQEAKDKLIGQFIIGQETNLEKASSLGWFEASGRGYNFKKEYVNLINNVTEFDIIEVANKYFNNNYVISIVTNQNTPTNK